MIRDERQITLRAALRGVAHEARRWGYLDLGGGPEDTTFVAGSGRSGTTWVEEVINRNRDHRVMFEPFWGEKVPAAHAFTEGLYLRPGTSDPTYTEPAARILSGRIRNRWIDHHNTVHLARRRLVKEVRGNNWIGWAAERWPRMRVVFVMRHPMAVACSARRLGWADGLDRLLLQDDLVRDHLDPDQVRYLRSLDRPWERFIARWAVENLIPFRTLGGGRATLVLYEQLVAEPGPTATRLVRSLGQEPDAHLDAALSRPSRLSRPVSTAGGQSDPLTGWQSQVSSGDRRRGVEILGVLGMGTVYGDGPAPDVAAAEALWGRAGGARLER